MHVSDRNLALSRPVPAQSPDSMASSSSCVSSTPEAADAPLPQAALLCKQGCDFASGMRASGLNASDRARVRHADLKMTVDSDGWGGGVSARAQ
eukprot:7370608-Lingulodinium_polyedra.AAC.1